MEVRNRFKGLYLIDRVPDELWTEVHDIVQEVVIKTIPKKKAKWLSEEGLQIADKRREARGKGEISHPYMITEKTIALTRQTFVDKVMSLLFSMLSRLIITFFPRSVF